MTAVNPPMTEKTRFVQGQLLSKAEQVSQQALKSGALVPIPTSFETFVDDGIPFQIRLLTHLNKKAKKAIQVASKEVPRPAFNPFLPFDKELFVADLSESHAVVLNKYNVLPNHMLLITRTFHSQLDDLDLSNFQAACTGLSEVDGLIFFNGGEAAGASQPHKHLQLLPLEEPLAIANTVDEALNQAEKTPVKSFPFAHGLRRVAWDIDSIEEIASSAYQDYLELLSEIKHKAAWQESTEKHFPYNLLMTRHWLLLIPRRVEFYEGVSVNSMGFAGGFLAKNQEQVENIKTIGPLNILRHVGYPISK